MPSWPCDIKPKQQLTHQIMNKQSYLPFALIKYSVLLKMVETQSFVHFKTFSCVKASRSLVQQQRFIEPALVKHLC